MLTLRARIVLAAVTGLIVPLVTAAALPVPPPATDQAVAQQAAAILQDPASPVIGDPHADVAVVEFFDYDCSYCKALEPRLEQLLSTDKGVKLILKEFPILTPESLIAAKASLASVKQHKYRQFHDALMAYKGPWGTAAIYDTAKSVGLDITRLRHDMASAALDHEIEKNFNLARSLRIFQTPGFIVGGHILAGPSAEINFPQVVAAARAN